MKILAIETSCDDTCIALIEACGKKRIKFNVLSNVISSQVKIHRKWGGIVPNLARREHQKNLVPVLIQALDEANVLQKPKTPRTNSFRIIRGRQIKNKKISEILRREEYLQKALNNFLNKYQKPEIDAIAVTVGPGLAPTLWVGVNFAKALAYYWDLPIIPVNHIEAHMFVNWLTPISSKSKIKDKKSKIQIKNKKIEFPAICLIVSGGHTQLILMKDFGKYKILGETRDDAAGECFDKIARILGLGYPGGPIIATYAAMKSKVNPPADGQKSKVKLPRPMMYTKDYDFSFSGLKTAVLYKVKGERLKIKDKRYIQHMCWEAQQAIIDVLIAKTMRAAKEHSAKTIMIGGGVAANKELRKQLSENIKEQLPHTLYLAPNISLCTDNAVMIAITGYYHWLLGKKKSWKKIKVNANLKI